MKKVIGLALIAGAAMSGAASAQEISANINITSDYIFRGVSLSDNNPALQGGFDVTADNYYVGIWGSSLSSGTEFDVYGGFTPTVGPVSLDLGVIGYFYPGADDEDAEFDYYELKAAGETDLTEQFAVGAAVYYAPENYGETGNALYYEINGTYTASDVLEFTGAVGNQSVDDADGPLPDVTQESDYTTWNLGATYALHGFSLDLRYHDTDIDAGSDIEYYTYGPSSYDSAVVFTVGREL